MLINKRICFIGAGAMAEAILSGLIRKGVVNSEFLSVTNRSNESRLHELSQKYGVQADASRKSEFIKHADILMLAMKPKDTAATLEEIRAFTHSGQLIISVAAGVTTDRISALLGHDAPVIRSMPNTSAAIGQSVTGLCGGAAAEAIHFETASQIFESIGKVFQVEEGKIDSLTAVSGSGPAFFYYFVEAMLAGARDVGLDERFATELVQHTMLGAANMLIQSGKEPSKLRVEICSPGGTTLAGLDVLQSRGFEDAIRLCVQAAARRAAELGKKFS
ncbi:hypothetical protein SD71_10165 [Cohnella kolymensis]|uniref:Pyrroline-5-carboxylate reductase n=1 Tax=Cohnella kolymensis TaxID=1590652 RepID=A0ABR5A3Z5_9BACL|nr:pyrroline-5-carboxylate reductase [Cohnella kolymensis]KIL35771.1 hypothetical protein SD71_10165 [Cohnella kolymensis]